MLDRRSFLKLAVGAAAGAAVGTLASPIIWKSLDDLSIWTQNWPWIPRLEKGETHFVRTVSKMCPSSVATKVRLVNDRTVTVSGSEDNPLGGGGVTALAAAEAQMRYAPERVQKPLRKKQDGSYEAISWEEARALLVAKLQKVQKAANKDEALAVISGDENGTINDLLSGLTGQLGSNRFFMMPHEAQSVARAFRLVDGMGRVGYDIANSDCVIAIGADILETWGPVVPTRTAWSATKSSPKEVHMQLAFAGPVLSNTAAGADLWVPLKPNHALSLLLALINAAFEAKATKNLKGLSELRELAKSWTAEKLEKVGGVPQSRFTALVDMLLKAKKPVIIVGSETDQGGALAPFMTGFILNALLGRINTPGGLLALPVAQPAVPKALTYDDMMHKDLLGHCLSLAQKKQKASKLLLIYDANPAYAMPNTFGDTLLSADTFTVSFSSFFDETARKSDLVLPLALGLERFDDVVNPFAVASQVHAAVVPVTKPLYESKSAGEVLMGIGKDLGLDLGAKNFIGLLQKKAHLAGANWKELVQGEVFASNAIIPQRPIKMQASVLEEAAKAIEKPDNRLLPAFVSRRSYGTATTAIPPFNLKTISEKDLEKNILVGRINETTALRQNLREGQRIYLLPERSEAVGQGREAVGQEREAVGQEREGAEQKTKAVQVIVRLDEGVTNNTIALALGFGHTAFPSFNGNKGDNALRLVTSTFEPGTKAAVWVGGVVSTTKG